MKPIAIFRHDDYNHPELFLEYLEVNRIPHRLIFSGGGEAVPLDHDAYAGLVFMGGVASANDELPWIHDSIDLIRRAVNADIPVLGHCLGGQLLAKAMGSSIRRAPEVEIGWFPVASVTTETQKWFGRDHFHVMQWHSESFDLPEGAVLLLEGQVCPNQAYLLNDVHIGMQFHIEMRLPRLLSWMEDTVGADNPYAGMQYVHGLPQVMRDAEQHLGIAHTAALTLYKQWLGKCYP